MKAQETYRTEKVLEQLKTMRRVIACFETQGSIDGPIHVVLVDDDDDQVMMLSVTGARGGLTLDEFDEQMERAGEIRRKPSMWSRLRAWFSRDD